MPLIRKEQAGNDSFGNSWPEDGAVIEVAPEHAQALLGIADAGFSEVAPAAEKAPEDPDPEVPEGKKEISEVDPEAPASEPESKTPAKTAAARKTASTKPVEE